MRSLGGEIQSASGVASPAVVTAIPEVVGVCIGHVLRAIVALTVNPVLTLQQLGPLSGRCIGVTNVEEHVGRKDALKSLIIGGSDLRT